MARLTGSQVCVGIPLAGVREARATFLVLGGYPALAGTRGQEKQDKGCKATLFGLIPETSAITIKPNSGRDSVGKAR